MILLLATLLACSTTADVSDVPEVSTTETVTTEQSVDASHAEATTVARVPCTDVADDGSCLDVVAAPVAQPASASVTVTVTPVHQ